MVSYTGQPVTCYVCNSTTHMAQECPARQKRTKDTGPTLNKTWARVVEVGHIQTSNITQDSLAGVQEDREQFNRQIAPTTTQQDQTSNNTLNKQIHEKPVQAECTGPQSTEMDREDNKRCWKQQTEKNTGQILHHWNLQQRQ